MFLLLTEDVDKVSYTYQQLRPQVLHEGCSQAFIFPDVGRSEAAVILALGLYQNQIQA